MLLALLGKGTTRTQDPQWLRFATTCHVPEGEDIHCQLERDLIVLGIARRGGVRASGRGAPPWFESIAGLMLSNPPLPANVTLSYGCPVGNAEPELGRAPLRAPLPVVGAGARTSGVCLGCSIGRAAPPGSKAGMAALATCALGVLGFRLREHAGRDILERDELFRSIVDALPTLVCYLDRDLRYRGRRHAPMPAPRASFAASPFDPNRHHAALSTVPRLIMRSRSFRAIPSNGTVRPGRRRVTSAPWARRPNSLAAG